MISTGLLLLGCFTTRADDSLISSVKIKKSQSTLVESTLGINLFIQPLLRVTNYQTTRDSIFAQAALNRAKIDLQSVQTTPIGTLEAEVKLDCSKFLENNTVEALNVATISYSPAKRTTFMVGRFKTPFGLDLNTASSKLFFIERTRTSDYIRNTLQVGGYQQGFMVTGDLPFKIKIKGALFDYTANTQTSELYQQLLSLPMAHIEYKPIKGLSLHYAIAAPGLGSTLASGRTFTYQTTIHDLGIKFKIPEIYEGSLETFIGDPGLHDPLRLAQWPHLNTFIDYSLTLQNKLSFQFLNCPLSAALEVEYLSGNNPLPYSISEAILWNILPTLSLQAAFNHLHDRNFTIQNRQTFALQATYSYSIELIPPAINGTEHDPD